MHRDVETMESDPGWLQGIGRLDHHVEGDYYVDKNNGMWVLEDIPIGVHAEDYDRWDRKPGGYTYGLIKQRLFDVKWNIVFAIDRCTYELA